MVKKFVGENGSGESGDGVAEFVYVFFGTSLEYSKKNPAEQRPDLINSAIPAKDKGSRTGLAHMVR